MYLTSSQTPQKPSGRKGSKKVRTGCITCKIRKVKCDEAKPFCLRCIKTGRQCDGYRPSPSSSPEPKALTPSPGFETPQEVRAFDHYRRRTARVLSGAIDSSFWGGVVLKMSTTEPAVRHAMLAISSLHESVESHYRGIRKIDTRFAFREYSEAIKSLRDWGQRNEPPLIPLLVCVLFICIEFLIDRDMAAQMHICQGRQILSALGDGHSPAMEMIKHSLVPIYTRLSPASFLFGSRPAPIPAHLRAWTETPIIFTSVEEARYALYMILDEALQFSTSAQKVKFNMKNADPAEILYFQQEQQRQLTQLNRWHAAFTVVTSMSPQSPAMESSLNILRIYHQTAFIWLSSSLDTGETVFDSYTANFATIISLASIIIGSVPANAKLEPFSFETEIIPPIYWTAVRCRHPLLRRAALKLLTRDQVRNRRENLWHARETAVIAARSIELEEAGFEVPMDLDLNMNPGAASSPNTLSEGSPSDSDDLNILTCSASKVKIEVTEPPSLPPPPISLNDMKVEEFHWDSPYNKIDSTYNSDGSPHDFDSNMSSPSSAPEALSEAQPGSPVTAAVDSIQQLDINALKSANLESPFGIPEERRMKNAIIGPADEGGTWVTFFREPEPGKTEWRVTREFLRC
ncbi:transcriptional regulatory moc3 [Fusarium heterosporum]|uniref:Transcriptional regulatory moc3 n=1 Tax=Fusarium heterosporum TaxID=42747 RepID=A0A8H5TVX9_FUSHE|nr:transcriptional regulatory moc3 [Fusarium heterosporum]